MSLTKHLVVGLSLTSILFAGAPLGFVEQRFAYLHFEKDKWTRAAQPPCYIYTAREDNATVELLGIGSSDLVPFRAKKGLTVTACGEVAALEEGFETGAVTPRAASPNH
jgi:hypothetical protein